MPKGIKKGAGAAAAGATSDLFKDDPPAPSAQASTDFSDGFSEQAKDYIIAQKLDEPSDTGKAASTFQQLSVEQQREIKRATVRYIVMKALSGDGLIRAKELHTAIMLPGKYATDTKAITALYLVSVAAPVLERVFGIGVSTARKTLDMKNAEESAEMSSVFLARMVFEPTAQLAQPHRDTLTAARRGLLMAVLGVILTQAEKAVGEDTLFSLLTSHGLLPDADDAAGAPREDGLSNWRAVIAKEFTAAGYLQRNTRQGGEADSGSAERRAAAGLGSKDDRHVYRIGPRARGTIGTTALLEYVCQLTGTPLPSADKLGVALGPEAAGVKVPDPGRKRKREE